MITKLWFDALVAAANTCAWASARYRYSWDPGVKVSAILFARNAPRGTTVRKALRYAQVLWLFRKCGDRYAPWPQLDELDKIDADMMFLDEYAQIAEYIATNMDQRRRPAVDAWAKRAEAAHVVLQRSAA